MTDSHIPYLSRNITDDDVAAIAAAIRAPKRRHATALRLLGQLASSVVHYQALVKIGSRSVGIAEKRLSIDLDEVSAFLRGGSTK